DDVLAVELGEVRGEGALRAHDIDAIAGMQFAVRPAREAPAEIALDGDANAAGARGAAERIAAAYLVTVDLGAQGDVLTGNVAERTVQLTRHGERHLDAVRRERSHLGDLELVEAGTVALADRRCARGRRREGRRREGRRGGGRAGGFGDG